MPELDLCWSAWKLQFSPVFPIESTGKFYNKTQTLYALTMQREDSGPSDRNYGDVYQVWSQACVN